MSNFYCMFEDMNKQEVYKMMDEIIDERIEPLKKAGYMPDDFQLSATARQELRNKIGHMIGNPSEWDWIKRTIITYIRGYQVGLSER